MSRDLASSTVTADNAVSYFMCRTAVLLVDCSLGQICSARCLLVFSLTISIELPVPRRR